jgi:hypothetical protein
LRWSADAAWWADPLMIEIAWSGYIEEQDDLHRIAFMGAAQIPPTDRKKSDGNRPLTPVEAFRQRALVHNKLLADAAARRQRAHDRAQLPASEPGGSHG